MTTPDSLPTRQLTSTAQEHLDDHGFIKTLYDRLEGADEIPFPFNKLPVISGGTYEPPQNQGNGTSVALSWVDARFDIADNVDLMKITPDEYVFYDQTGADNFQMRPNLVCARAGWYEQSCTAVFGVAGLAAGNKVGILFGTDVDFREITLTAADISAGTVTVTLRAVGYFNSNAQFRFRLTATPGATITSSFWSVRAMAMSRTLVSTIKQQAVRQAATATRTGEIVSVSFGALTAGVSPTAEAPLRIRRYSDNQVQAEAYYPYSAIGGQTITLDVTGVVGPAPYELILEDLSNTYAPVPLGPILIP